MLNKLVLTYDTLLHLKWHLHQRLNPMVIYFGAKTAKPGETLSLCNFTIILTSSAVQPVGETNVEMVTLEKCIVTAPV